jgi:hypothetical protein
MKTLEETIRESAVETALFEEMAGVLKRACAMHHEGLETEAIQMAGALLPDLFERWSRLCPLNASEKRSRIISLLIEEGKKAGEPDLVSKIIFSRMNSRAALRKTACEYLSCGGLSGSINLVGTSEQARS